MYDVEERDGSSIDADSLMSCVCPIPVFKKNCLTLVKFDSF